MPGCTGPGSCGGGCRRSSSPLWREWHPDTVEQLQLPSKYKPPYRRDLPGKSSRIFLRAPSPARSRGRAGQGWQKFSDFPVAAPVQAGTNGQSDLEGSVRVSTVKSRMPLGGKRSRIFRRPSALSACDYAAVMVGAQTDIDSHWRSSRLVHCGVASFRLGTNDKRGSDDATSTPSEDPGRSAHFNFKGMRAGHRGGSDALLEGGSRRPGRFNFRIAIHSE